MEVWKSGRFLIGATGVGFAILILTSGAFAGIAMEFDRATRKAMKGDAAGARQEYAAFLERAPEDRLAPVALLAIAEIDLGALGDTVAGLSNLERVVLAYPRSSCARDAARRQGDCLGARGRWREAGEAYALALRLAEGATSETAAGWTTTVTQAAADCYGRAGMEAEMVATYVEALEGEPSPEIAGTALSRIAAYHVARGDEAAASTAYERLLREYPSSEHLADALARREMIAKHHAIAWTPFDAYAAGTSLVAARDYPAALAKTEEALAAAPPPALRECLEYRKITLETTIAGDYTEGCRRLRAFLREHPDGLRSRMAKETIEGRYGPIAEIEAAVAKQPQDLELLQTLGGSYTNAMAGARAVEILERAREIDPADAQTHLLLGYAYSQIGRSKEALEAFEIYLRSNPEDTTALNMIGYGLLGQGRAEEAIPYFEKYAALAPDDPNAHDSLGEGYLAAGRIEDAAREYERAVGINRDFSNSHFMLGRVYRALGRLDDAVRAYERFLALASAGPQAEEARAAIRTIVSGAGEAREN